MCRFSARTGQPPPCECPRRRSRSPHKRAPAGPVSSSATECLIYCGLSAPTPFTVVVSTRCFSSMSVTASVSGSCSRCSSVVSRDGFPLRVPASHGFPASTRRKRRRGDDRAPSAASRSSTGRADECRRAVAGVALVVHGPAGPHGGAGAPAERALRTGALGRHACRPPTSPCRRRRTFCLPVAPPRANVDGRRLPAAATTEGPSP